MSGRRRRSSPSGGWRRARRRCRRGSTRRTEVVAPVRVLLELPVPAIDGATASGSRQEDRDEPARDLLGHLVQVHLRPSRWGIRPEVVAVVVVDCSSARMRRKFTGIQIGPRQLELPPNMPVSDSAGWYLDRYSWPPTSKRRGDRRDSARASGCRRAEEPLLVEHPRQDTAQLGLVQIASSRRPATPGLRGSWIAQSRAAVEEPVGGRPELGKRSTAPGSMRSAATAAAADHRPHLHPLGRPSGRRSTS